MPLGIVGSLSIVTLVYLLMVVVLCLMVPRAAISKAATYAAAFDYVGLPWVKYIVSVGAIMGMLTGIMIGIYAPARVLAGAAKEGMLPPIFAWVGARQTPWVATIFIGGASAVLALLADFESLTNMVAAATLLAFWMVALALLWRRNHVHGERPGLP